MLIKRSNNQTLIDIWKLVLEIHKCRHTGDAVVVGGGGVRDFHKMNPVNITIIIDILHDFQDSLCVSGF